MAHKLNLENFSVKEIVNKQIYNINWDDKNINFETRKFQNQIKNELDSNVGIVIDNGSYEVRAGYSIFEEPNLRFRSIVAKPKIQTKNDNTFLVGNEMLSMEQGKLHKKSPFEKNYILHFGAQEHILDHIFENLNINNNNGVDHPVIISEPIFNLNWSRKNLSEMMFELYNVPKLGYGVDMLFSLGHNIKNSESRENCLIISSSYQTTHIVPILNGKIVQSKVRRINIGSFHGNELLTKSLNLRYPDLRQKFTSEIIQDIQEKYTMSAIDYKKQINLLQSMFEYDQNKIKQEEKKRMFGSIEMYEKANYEEIIQKKIQMNKYSHLKKYKNMIEYQNEQIDEDNNDLITDLIFFEFPHSENEIVLTEEELRRKSEIRKEQSRRLRELMQKKREENMKILEKELVELEFINSLKSGDKYLYEEAIMNKGFATSEELEKRINKIFMKINFNKENKEENINIIPEIEIDKRWPLLNLPDEDLTDEQIKMKKIHRMQRQAYLNRLEKRERQKKEKERVEELRQQDPESYLVNLYRKKKEVIDRLEKYKQVRKDFTSRTSKVNRGRMMMIAEMDFKKGENPTDDFGVNDEDWEVYRGISRHNLSEDEEEDSNLLQEIEAQIIESDPNYFKYSDNINNDLMFSHNHLCLGVDQFRPSELLFQPYIIGNDQAGVIEIILSILRTMTYDEQKLLAGNIFITGGFAKTPYLKERIYKDLRCNLHCDIDINITLANDPELDPWKGMREFINDDNNEKSFITKEEYYECGYDYFKENSFSNPIVKNASSFNYEMSGKKQKLI